jgi:hypothetical protein
MTLPCVSFRMRSALLVLALTSCTVPSGIMKMAADRLNSHGRRLSFEGMTQIGDRDVYTFCRASRSGQFDGACVTLVCLHGDDETGCR